MLGILRIIIFCALAVLAVVCVIPCEKGYAREGETLDAERYETLVTSILGRRALVVKPPQGNMEEALLLQFWMDTLSFQCKTDTCEAFQWTDESLWRVMGLAEDARAQAMMSSCAPFRSRMPQLIRKGKNQRLYHRRREEPDERSHRRCARVMRSVRGKPALCLSASCCWCSAS